MTDRQLMQQALDALEELNETNSYWWQEVDEATLAQMEAAIVALNERLAHCDRCGKRLGGEGDIHTCTPDPIGDAQSALIAEMAAQPAQPAQPAQRKPLTDEQIYAMCSDFHSWSEWDGGNFQKFWLDLCRAIEAAHGIGENT